MIWHLHIRVWDSWESSCIKSIIWYETHASFDTWLLSKIYVKCEIELLPLQIKSNVTVFCLQCYKIKEQEITRGLQGSSHHFIHEIFAMIRSNFNSHRIFHVQWWYGSYEKNVSCLLFVLITLITFCILRSPCEVSLVFWTDENAGSIL